MDLFTYSPVCLPGSTDSENLAGMDAFVLGKLQLSECNKACLSFLDFETVPQRNMKSFSKSSDNYLGYEIMSHLEH